MNSDGVASWRLNPGLYYAVIVHPAAPIDLRIVLTRAVQNIQHAEFQPEVLLCHPHEHAWATKPIGRAPSGMAIYVALIMGTIDWGHPEAHRLLDEVTARFGAAPPSGQVGTPDCAPTSPDPEDDH